MTSFIVQAVTPDSDYVPVIKVMYNKNMNTDFVKIFYDFTKHYHKQTLFQADTFLCYRHIMETIDYFNNHKDYIYYLCEQKALIYINDKWFYIGDLIWDLMTNPTSPLDNYKEVDGDKFPHWCVNRINEEIENIKKNHSVRCYRILQSNNEKHKRFTPFIVDIIINGKIYYKFMDDSNSNNMEID